MGVRVAVTKERISLDELASEIMRASAPRGGGALAIFVGFVKGTVNGRSVRGLVYEAHEEYALEKLREIGKWGASMPGVHDVVIIHRVGRLGPGEPTVYIVVSAEDRRSAFEAASRVLERVKHEAPVFKLELREDGEYWVLSDGRRVPRPGAPPEARRPRRSA